MDAISARRASMRWDHLPYAAFAVVTIVFATSRFSLLDFPLDDAWIHRVYAQSFAYGHGFEYNPGQREAGSTSPLWAIVTAPAHWLQFLGSGAVVVAVKLVGVALAMASIGAVIRLGNHADKEPVGLVAAALFALDPRLAFSALAGMETSLLVALWLWSSHALMTKRAWWACLLMSLTPTTRPEAVVLLPFFVLAFVLVFARERNRPRWVALTLLPFPMLVWGLFCRTTNGHWLPTTVYVKGRFVGLGIDQLDTLLRSVDFRGLLPSAVALSLVGFVLVVLLVQRSERGLPLVLQLILAPAAYLIGVVATRTVAFEGYYTARWVEPPALVLSVTACVGLALLGNRGSVRMFLPPTLARIAALVLIGVSIPHSVGAFLEQRHHLIHDSRAIRLINVRAGEWISENTPPDAIVAVNDAGAIRFFGRRKTLDLIGLNNAEIAFTRDRAAAVAQADWVAIFPSWFEGAAFLQSLEPVQVVSIPPEEYTISAKAARKQSTLVIYRHKSSR